MLSAETFEQKHILLMNVMDVEASVIPQFDGEKKARAGANWLGFTWQTRADVIGPNRQWSQRGADARGAGKCFCLFRCACQVNS